MSFINMFLDDAQPNSLVNVANRQTVDVRSLERRTLNVDTLNQITPRIGTRIDTNGAVSVIKLNYITFFNTAVTPVISIPPGALTGDNILEITLTGKMFQNTGLSQTMTPRAYIGKAGSETLVTSETALSYATGSKQRAFTYTVRICQAPCLGTWVQCDEEFVSESQTDGYPSVILRSTTTQIIDVNSLDEVDSFYMRIANGATATMFRIYSNKIYIRVLDGIGTEEVHWYSQPNGTAGYDALLDDAAPNTNYGSNVQIFVGENNLAVEDAVSLIKFPDIANIPANAQIKSVFLHLTIAQDLATNTGNLDVYRVLRDWTESGVTWNKYDGANNWGTAGCRNSTTDYDGSVLWGTTAFAASETVGIVKGISLSVAEFDKWRTGVNPNYGLLMKMRVEANNMYCFHSAESATPELSPILEVIYTLPN